MLSAGQRVLKALTVCCAAVAGSTMPATAVRLAATGTSRLTVTTTLAFALPSSTVWWMLNGRPAFCPDHKYRLWQTDVGCCALVARAVNARNGY